MAIDRRSRYSKSPQVPWTRSDGSEVTLIGPTSRPRRAAVFAVTATDTDRLDALAARYYRNPEKLWLIADAASAFDPFDVVVPGARVAIPPDK